jgi:hypothetical protein
MYLSVFIDIGLASGIREPQRGQMTPPIDIEKN